MLWAPGFWIWEGATGDFTMAPASARRHGTPTNPHLLAAAVAPTLDFEKRREPLRHRAASPPLHRPTVSRAAIVYRVTSSSSPAQPSPGPRFKLIANCIGVGISIASSSFTALLRCPPPALSCPHCRCLTAVFFYFLALTTLTPLNSSLTSRASSFTSHHHHHSLTFHPSVLSPRISCLTFYQATRPPPIRHQPHDEALPFVLARAGPIRDWRRLCAPP